MSTTRNNSHDRLTGQKGLTSHDRVARTILRRIRSTRSSSAPDIAFVASEQALLSVGVTFTVVEAPATINPALVNPASPGLASAA